MKVVLLAGGFGTRLSEYTDIIPKPMVHIHGKPILLHIIDIYNRFNHKEFYIAIGYKSEIIKEFFNNNSVSCDSSKTKYYLVKEKISINLLDTGKETMTGGRLKRLEKYIGKETFLFTYGDGVADVNINELIKFHKSHGKLVTVTAVRPPARFGKLEIKEDKVLSFKEKSQLDEGWINGGYFVVEPEFLKYIKDDNTFLEKEPLEKAAELDQLRAFKHYGFWQCMDTKRDKENLEKMKSIGKFPWQ